MSKQMLYKSGFVTFTEADTRMIDSNDLFQKKFEEFAQKLAETPVSQITASVSEELCPEQVARLLADDSDEEVFREGIQTNQEERLLAKKDEILSLAREEAEQIVSKAQEDAVAFREAAQEEGRQNGWQTGYREGTSQAKKEFEIKSKELEQQKSMLEQEYTSLIEELEPTFINKITDIYEHIFKVSLSDHKNLIVNLVENAMHNLSGAKDYLVHVSKADYVEVSGKKELLIQSVSGMNATVEVIEDITLAAGECMIETSGGIYDCSLGTQLSELSKELKLLSYERN